MKPDKWVGASAYDCLAEPTNKANAPIEQTIERAGLSKHLDDPAFVFPIGHSADVSCFPATLREVLLEGRTVNECVISLVPGRLAVCFGHSGEVRVCKRR